MTTLERRLRTLEAQLLTADKPRLREILLKAKAQALAHPGPPEPGPEPHPAAGPWAHLLWQAKQRAAGL